MKIVYLLNVTSLSDGSTKSFLALLKGMMALGHVPHVLVPDPGDVYMYLKEKGIAVSVIPFRPQVTPQVFDIKSRLLFFPILLTWVVKNIIARRQLRKLIADFHPDIIHTNSSVVGVGMQVAKEYGIPHICHIREYGDKDFCVHYIPSRKAFLDRVTAANSYSICITDDIQRYNNLDSVPSSKVIYNGVSDEKPFVWDEDKGKYFLYAGRIEKTKGLLPLLEGYCEYAKRCKTEDVLPLYVAGRVVDNDYWNRVERFVKDNHLSDFVHILGNRSDILSLMSKARAVVVPSLNEGFGRSMAEAMFCGTLVIGYNVAGTKEQFDNGRKMMNKEIGMPYNTKDELIDILCTVASSELQIYEDTCRCANVVVNRLYSVQSYVNSVNSLYTQVCRQSI